MPADDRPSTRAYAADPGRLTAVKTYGLAGLALCVFMLALFGLAVALHVPLLSDASPDLGQAGIGAAAASFALLVADVVLPVPSSAVMILNGALFGVVAGSLLSLSASVMAALLAAAIGRRGGTLLERVVPADQRRRAAALVERRGAMAITLTRPVPIVAETVAVLAGAAGMPLGRVALAATVGSIPPAIAYAAAGAGAARAGQALVVFGGVLLFAAAMWLVDRSLHRTG